MIEGKGISQRIYMHNPQNQTTVWCQPEGRGGRSWVEVDKESKGMGIYVIRSNNKKQRHLFKKILG